MKTVQWEAFMALPENGRIKLVGGMAPTCYMEQLVYDCRLMNEAAKDGPEGRLQMPDWMVRSDAALDPQACIISPESSIVLAEAIVAEKSRYAAASRNSSKR